MYTVGLSASGFDVVPAPDGNDAFQRAWMTHPDVIVTEVALPPTDGWGLVHDLKLDPRTRDIPILLLTGYSQASIQDRAVREGCVAVMIKPCLPEQLALGLREILSRHVYQ
jgi:CheY-like chemotaxis protein